MCLIYICPCFEAENFSNATSLREDDEQIKIQFTLCSMKRNQCLQVATSEKM